MTPQELLWKRKYKLYEKLDEWNIAAPEMELSEFEFDKSKVKTAYEVGARLVTLESISYCEHQPALGINVLNWLKEQGLSKYLMADELNFLQGDCGFGDLPYYSWFFVVRDEMQWAVNDFEGITDKTKHEARRDFSKTVCMKIALGLPVHDMLSSLVLKDPEELFLEYLISKIQAAQEFDKTQDLTHCMELLDIFRVFSWMTGIESELLKKIPLIY